jgi:DNA repair protein RadD
MSRYRPYQQSIEDRSFDAWFNRGARVVAPVLATGGGKTVVIGGTVKRMSAPTCAIAHRQELVGQISLALAREGIRHGIVAQKKTVQSIVASHMDDEDVGRSFFDPHSPVRVAGVDTLIGHDAANDAWFRSVRLVVQDEGHHVLRTNKWGKAFGMFPSQPYGMFPTATFCRADGAGLGIGADGFVDEIVEGPSMRALIEMGYLTDYRVVAPPPSVDLSQVAHSAATGDFNQSQVRKAVHQSSRLVGDVVKEYLRWAPGKLGVTFAVDVESATEIAQAFRAAGVPAEVVSAKTPDDVRRNILKRFKRREILQLVNVDLFGEGFDLPAIEVVSMARPTDSYSLYAQQFGRALRLMLSPILRGAWDTYTDAQRRAFIAQSDKPKALIIDHVGNVERHGLPDAPRQWARGLDRRERSSRALNDGGIPLRICLSETCMQPYERIHKSCPHCGFYPPPPEARGIEQVDGDLTELDPELLAAMRGEIARIDSPTLALPPGLPYAAEVSAQKRHRERQVAQRDLRHAIGSWAAVYSDSTDSQNYRRFFLTFGMDVATAQTLYAKEAEALHARIAERLALDGYALTPTPIPQPPGGIPA